MLQPYIVTIFNLLLHRLQESVKQSKKVPFCKYFIHNICLFSAVYGSQTLYNTLESLTNGLVTMLVMNIWSENRGNCAQLDSQDIKHILIGGTKLLCETPIATNIEVFSSLFHSLLVLVSDDDEVHGNYDLHVDDNAEDRAFDSTYSKLAYAMVPNVDPCLDVTSGPVYFVTTLANFTRSRPGQYGHVISTALNSFGTSSASLTQTFQGLLQQHGLSLA